jgi:DNA repair exonuclease SbcCD nuclease subunit
MMHFIIRTDCHTAHTAPRSRRDDYEATCLNKLRQIGDLATQYNAVAVLDNGDFFHHKSPQRTPHSLIQKVTAIHRDTYPCPVYINPGNHDFSYAHLGTLQDQPLGVLLETGVFKLMSDVTFTRGHQRVRVVGLPYKIEFSAQDFDIKKGEEDLLIVAAHTFASLQGGETFGRERAVSYLDIVDFDPDCYVFGHWHVDQGIQVVKNKPFFNLGSMTRGSLTQDEIKRTPRVGLLTFHEDNTVTTQAIPLKVAPATEIFDVKAYESSKLEESRMNAYLGDLALAFQEQDNDPSDVKSVVQSSGYLPQEVKDRALYYLEITGKATKT